MNNSASIEQPVKKKVLRKPIRLSARCSENPQKDSCGYALYSKRQKNSELNSSHSVANGKIKNDAVMNVLRQEDKPRNTNWSKTAKKERYQKSTRNINNLKSVTKKGCVQHPNEKALIEANSCVASIVGNVTLDRSVSDLRRTRVRNPIDYRRLSNEGLTLPVQNVATAKLQHNIPTKCQNSPYCAEDTMKKTKVTNHKSELSAKSTCKRGRSKTYRNKKKEERYIRALQGNISPPSDAENIGNVYYQFRMSLTLT